MTADDHFAVEVRKLAKTFGEGQTRVDALRGVDLAIPPGEFVAVMGPSGSGKSTLLHLIGGLDPATGGSVHVGGDDLAAMDDDTLTLLRRKRIGFVFQAFNLLGVLSAHENVALPLVIDGMSASQADRRAAEALRSVGIDERRRHRPGELSGGEQQRVAIARALVTDPLILLADEPTGNLDSATGDQIIAILRNLADDKGQTIMMVTHDPRHAAIADRVVRLRDGRIVDEQRMPGERPTSEVLADLESAP